MRQSRRVQHGLIGFALVAAIRAAVDVPSPLNTVIVQHIQARQVEDVCMPDAQIRIGGIVNKFNPILRQVLILRVHDAAYAVRG